MWIGEEEIIDNDGLHGMETRDGSVELEAGLHPFTILFFEHYGGAGLVLEWASRERIPREVIPSHVFAPVRTVRLWPIRGRRIAITMDWGMPATGTRMDSGRVGGSVFLSFLDGDARSRSLRIGGFRTCG